MFNVPQSIFNTSKTYKEKNQKDTTELRNQTNISMGQKLSNEQG